MKQFDLFGEEVALSMARRTKADIFEDYDAFVAKFNEKAPKTTDDCYTPLSRPEQLRFNTRKLNGPV